MGGAKRTLIAVVLVAVAAVALWYAVGKVARTSGRKPPKSYMTMPVEKIDQKSLKLITKSMAEWEKLGQKNGKYKNPETGEYTMVEACRCQACGQKIPMPEKVSSEPGAVEPGEERIEKFRCPRCGAMTAPGGGYPRCSAWSSHHLRLNAGSGKLRPTARPACS